MKYYVEIEKAGTPRRGPSACINAGEVTEWHGLPVGWEWLRQRGEELRQAAWSVYRRGRGEWALYKLAERQTAARAEAKALRILLCRPTPSDQVLLRVDGETWTSAQVLEALDKHAAAERGLACA